MEIYGINGVRGFPRFIPLKEIEEECRLRELVREDIQRPVMTDRVDAIANSLKEGKTRQSVLPSCSRSSAFEESSSMVSTDSRL